MCFFHIYFQVSNYTYLVGLLLVPSGYVKIAMENHYF